MYAQIVNQHLSGMAEVAVGQVGQVAAFAVPTLQNSSAEECARYVASYFNGQFCADHWKACCIAQFGAIAAYHWMTLLKEAEYLGLVKYNKGKLDQYQVVR